MAVTHDYQNVSSIAIAFSRIAARFQDLVLSYRNRKAERETRAELMRLTDTELADIGLTRDQIPTLNLSKNA